MSSSTASMSAAAREEGRMDSVSDAEAVDMLASLADIMGLPQDTSIANGVSQCSVNSDNHATSGTPDTLLLTPRAAPAGDAANILDAACTTDKHFAEQWQQLLPKDAHSALLDTCAERETARRRHLQDHAPSTFSIDPHGRTRGRQQGFPTETRRTHFTTDWSRLMGAIREPFAPTTTKAIKDWVNKARPHSERPDTLVYELGRSYTIILPRESIALELAAAYKESVEYLSKSVGAAPSVKDIIHRAVDQLENSNLIGTCHWSVHKDVAERALRILHDSSLTTPVYSHRRGNAAIQTSIVTRAHAFLEDVSRGGDAAKSNRSAQERLLAHFRADPQLQAQLPTDCADITMIAVPAAIVSSAIQHLCVAWCMQLDAKSVDVCDIMVGTQLYSYRVALFQCFRSSQPKQRIGTTRTAAPKGSAVVDATDKRRARSSSKQATGSGSAMSSTTLLARRPQRTSCVFRLRVVLPVAEHLAEQSVVIHSAHGFGPQAHSGHPDFATRAAAWSHYVQHGHYDSLFLNADEEDMGVPYGIRASVCYEALIHPTLSSGHIHRMLPLETHTMLVQWRDAHALGRSVMPLSPGAGLGERIAGVAVMGSVPRHSMNATSAINLATLAARQIGHAYMHQCRPDDAPCSASASMYDWSQAGLTTATELCSVLSATAASMNTDGVLAKAATSLNMRTTYGRGDCAPTADGIKTLVHSARSKRNVGDSSSAQLHSYLVAMQRCGRASGYSSCICGRRIPDNCGTECDVCDKTLHVTFVDDNQAEFIRMPCPGRVLMADSVFKVCREDVNITAIVAIDRHRSSVPLAWHVFGKRAAAGSSSGMAAPPRSFSQAMLHLVGVVDGYADSWCAANESTVAVTLNAAPPKHAKRYPLFKAFFMDGDAAQTWAVMQHICQTVHAFQQTLEGTQLKTACSMGTCVVVSPRDRLWAVPLMFYGGVSQTPAPEATEGLKLIDRGSGVDWFVEQWEKCAATTVSPHSTNSLAQIARAILAAEFRHVSSNFVPMRHMGTASGAQCLREWTVAVLRILFLARGIINPTSAMGEWIERCIYRMVYRCRIHRQANIKDSASKQTFGVYDSDAAAWFQLYGRPASRSSPHPVTPVRHSPGSRQPPQTPASAGSAIATSGGRLPIGSRNLAGSSARGEPTHAASIPANLMHAASLAHFLIACELLNDTRTERALTTVSTLYDSLGQDHTFVRYFDDEVAGLLPLLWESSALSPPAAHEDSLMKLLEATDPSASERAYALQKASYVLESGGVAHSEPGVECKINAACLSSTRFISIAACVRTMHVRGVDTTNSIESLWRTTRLNLLTTNGQHPLLVETLRRVVGHPTDAASDLGCVTTATMDTVRASHFSPRSESARIRFDHIAYCADLVADILAGAAGCAICEHLHINPPCQAGTTVTAESTGALADVAPIYLPPGTAFQLRIADTPFRRVPPRLEGNPSRFSSKPTAQPDTDEKDMMSPALAATDLRQENVKSLLLWLHTVGAELRDRRESKTLEVRKHVTSGGIVFPRRQLCLTLDGLPCPFGSSSCPVRVAVDVLRGDASMVDADVDISVDVATAAALAVRVPEIQKQRLQQWAVDRLSASGLSQGSAPASHKKFVSSLQPLQRKRRRSSPGAAARDLGRLKLQRLKESGQSIIDVQLLASQSGKAENDEDNDDAGSNEMSASAFESMLARGRHEKSRVQFGHSSGDTRLGPGGSAALHKRQRQGVRLHGKANHSVSAASRELEELLSTGSDRGGARSARSTSARKRKPADQASSPPAVGTRNQRALTLSPLRSRPAGKQGIGTFGSAKRTDLTHSPRFLHEGIRRPEFQSLKWQNNSCAYDASAMLFAVILRHLSDNLGIDEASRVMQFLQDMGDAPVVHGFWATAIAMSGWGSGGPPPTVLRDQHRGFCRQQCERLRTLSSGVHAQELDKYHTFAKTDFTSADNIVSHALTLLPCQDDPLILSTRVRTPDVTLMSSLGAEVQLRSMCLKCSRPVAAASILKPGRAALLGRLTATDAMLSRLPYGEDCRISVVVKCRDTEPDLVLDHDDLPPGSSTSPSSLLRILVRSRPGHGQLHETTSVEWARLCESPCAPIVPDTEQHDASAATRQIHASRAVVAPHPPSTLMHSKHPGMMLIHPPLSTGLPDQNGTYPIVVWDLPRVIDDGCHSYFLTAIQVFKQDHYTCYGVVRKSFDTSAMLSLASHDGLLKDGAVVEDATYTVKSSLTCIEQLVRNAMAACTLADSATMSRSSSSGTSPRSRIIGCPVNLLYVCSSGHTPRGIQNETGVSCYAAAGIQLMYAVPSVAAIVKAALHAPCHASELRPEDPVAVQSHRRALRRLSTVNSMFQRLAWQMPAMQSVADAALRTATGKVRPVLELSQQVLQITQEQIRELMPDEDTIDQQNDVAEFVSHALDTVNDALIPLDKSYAGHRHISDSEMSTLDAAQRWKLATQPHLTTAFTRNETRLRMGPASHDVRVCMACGVVSVRECAQDSVLKFNAPRTGQHATYTLAEVISADSLTLPAELPIAFSSAIRARAAALLEPGSMRSFDGSALFTCSSAAMSDGEDLTLPDLSSGGDFENVANECFGETPCKGLFKPDGPGTTRQNLHARIFYCCQTLYEWSQVRSVFVSLRINNFLPDGQSFVDPTCARFTPSEFCNFPCGHEGVDRHVRMQLVGFVVFKPASAQNGRATTSAGHYVAVVNRCGRNKWWLMDDSRVELLGSFADIQRIMDDVTHPLRTVTVIDMPSKEEISVPAHVVMVAYARPTYDSLIP